MTLFATVTVCDGTARWHLMARSSTGHILCNILCICPRGREALASEAQDRWLQLFAYDLASDFEIDGFTRLAITSCYS